MSSRRAISKRTRDAVVARDGLYCAICGMAIAENRKSPHPLSLSFDHVFPVSKGGADDAENLRTTHLRCNVARGDESHHGISVTIELVLQIAANVVALGAPVEPLQLVGQLAQAFGLTSGSSGTLAQTLTVPELNEPAPVPQRR